MAKYNTLKELFTAIADAIRSKTGGTGAIVADDFPSAISAIETDKTEGEDGIITGEIETYSNGRVTSIRHGAFSSLFNLKSVSLPLCMEIGEGAFEHCYSLTDVDIPLVKTIPHQAFYACNNLMRIDLQKVEVIQDSAFGNTSLETLILRTTARTVAISSSSFPESAPETLTVYVPASMVEQYKTSLNWSAYADQIRAIEDYPEITNPA